MVLIISLTTSVPGSEKESGTMPNFFLRQQKKIGKNMGMSNRRKRGYYSALAAYGAGAGLLAGSYSGANRSNIAAKKYSRKSSKKGSSKGKKTLEKQIKDLSKRVSKNSKELSTHTRRIMSVGDLDRSVNEQNNVVRNLCSLSEVENALANLRYFNESANTLVTAAGATSGTAMSVTIENVHTTMRYQNAGAQVGDYRIYIMTAKADTSLDPFALWNDADTDQAPTGTANGNRTLDAYVTDLDAVNVMWDVKEFKRGTLHPGEWVEIKDNTGPFKYKNSVADVHGFEYQKSMKGTVAVFQFQPRMVMGVSVATQQGTPASRICYEEHQTYKIRYDAGGKVLNDYSFDTSTNSSIDLAATTTWRAVNKPDAVATVITADTPI